jgi:7-cyano-7-deazaguanine synthase in queuosine biosynthesis
MNVHVRRTRSLSGRSDEVELDLSNLRWFRHGASPPRAYNDAEKDLCEIARVVHEVERLLPKRIVADRIDTFEVAMPIRNRRLWDKATIKLLGEILRMQGNARWDFSFCARDPDELTQLDRLWNSVKVQKETSPIALALFSGGLDSASGLAGLVDQKDDILVMSYFTGNLAKQSQLVSDLGFKRHVQVRGQWDHPRGVRSGGSFHYRSFLFLALAAAEASANSVGRIFQFENGPLALAVAPAPIYRVTRHAHPRVHELATRVFAKVLKRKDLHIENPFVDKTKREVVEILRKWAGTTVKFAELVGRTETCWYLKSSSIVGAVNKKANTACGACIPCLVRKAALRSDDSATAIDLTSRRDPHFKNEVVRANVDSYLDLADRMLAAGYDANRFFAELPRVTAAYLVRTESILSVDQAFKLFQRFARELAETFPRP